MKARTAERAQRIGVFALAFALAFLACGTAMASDVERQITVIRDTAGSNLTTEISREGTRQTATPFLTLHDPTIERIEERIGKMIDRIAAQQTPSEATAAGSPSRIDPTGTQREDYGRPNTTISSLPRVPEEITFRTVKGFLKGVRASRKEKPAPAVVVAVPERRLGMVDASHR